MKLTTLFDKGEFVITGEVGPIKGAIHRDKSIEPSCAIEALQLHQHVHAVNVTDNQSAVMRLGSLAASVRLKANGVYSLGIDNVLLLTGDHIQLGDHKEAKPVFDLDSVQLIDMAKGLKRGYDISGSRIENYLDMAFGAVVNPNSDPIELQLMKMRKKIDAGAQFFQTQAVYDVKLFENFMKKADKFNCPIQIGFVILKTPQMGKFMNKNVSGIHVPDEWIDEIGSVAKEDQRKKAAEMAGKFIKQVKSMVQGVHIMPLGWTDIVPDILEHADIKPIK